MPAPLGLGGVNQLFRVIAELLCPPDELLNRRLARIGLARKHPQIAAARFANDRPTVIVCMIQDPVIAVEWPEEADLELRVRSPVDNLGAAPGFLGAAVRAPASIHDIDAAVSAQRVSGRYAGSARPFETLVVTRDFEPNAEITLQIDGLRRFGHAGVPDRVPLDQERRCDGSGGGGRAQACPPLG